MSLPTKERTWLYNVNQDLNTTGGYYADHQILLWTIKNSLVTMTGGFWRVKRSCDSSSVADYPTDLWTDRNAVLWGRDTNGRSWIVLQNTAVGAEMCIECHGQSSNPNTLNWYFSAAAGFTGGTTTQRPTATDEQGRAWYYGSSGHWTFPGTPPQAFSCALHMQMSDDGKATRWWVYYAGNLLHAGIVEQPIDYPAEWTAPVYCQVQSTWNDTPWTHLQMFVNSPGWGWKGSGSSYRGNIFMSSEVYGGTAYVCSYLSFVNDLSGVWEFHKIGLFSSSAGIRGILGRVADFYIKPAGVASLDCFPVSGSKLWVTVKDFIVPWNGTIMMTS